MTPAERQARIKADRSIRDGAIESARLLQSGLGSRDRARLTQYLENLREVERRIGRAEAQASAHPVELDAPVGALPPGGRLTANVQASGQHGGRDLHYRTLQRLGVTLLGHFLGADGRRARFAPDLGESVAWGDERNAQLMDLVRQLVAERGLPLPEIPEPADLSADELLQLLFDTLAEGDYSLLEARCRDHKSTIAEHLPTWLIVPDSLCANPAAARWYKRGIKHFARVCQDIS